MFEIIFVGWNNRGNFVGIDPLKECLDKGYEIVRTDNAREFIIYILKRK